MIRLTRVELRRLFARRLTLAGLAGVLVVTGVLMFSVWQGARPLSDAEERRAQVQFEQAQQDWELHGEENVKRCREEWNSVPDPKPAIEEFCGLRPPTRADFGKPPTVFTELMPDLLLGVSYLLAFAAFVIGASFVGAEFSSGAIGNWLTFEPRRLRVYGSKLSAMAVGLVPLAAVALGLLTAGAWLIVDHYGVVDGTTAKVWGDVAGTAGRTVAMTAVAGVIGAVLALLLRHTAAAIGVAIGYLVLVEGVFGGLVSKLQPWLVGVNFNAWIAHGTTYYVERCQSTEEGMYSCDSVEKPLSFAHGATYLTVATVLLVVAGALVFRRRDVN